MKFVEKTIKERNKRMTIKIMHINVVNIKMGIKNLSENSEKIRRNLKSKSSTITVK